jgi:hypothetical protein
MSHVSRWLGPPDEHQHDAVDVASRVDPAGRFQLQEILERESEQRQRTGVQEVAAPQAVAEMDALVRVELEHGGSARRSKSTIGSRRRPPPADYAGGGEVSTE